MTYTVITSNIRCQTPHDGEDNWPYRKDFLAEVLRSRQADIICFQEMSRQHHADLSAALSMFDSFGLPDTPTGDNPANTIFYDRQTFSLVAGSGYWLSETPHVPGSKSWDSSCIRLANWVVLRDRKTGVEFRVVNTHLDHISQPARENQARLIVEDAQAYPDDYPQLLTGDMNCDATNPAIGIFKAGSWIDTYASVHGDDEPGWTYHEFLGAKYQSDDVGKMDWIFMRGSAQATSSEIIKDNRNGRYPSDHYPIVAQVDIAGQESTSTT